MAPPRLSIVFAFGLIAASGCNSSSSPPPVTAAKLEWCPELDQPIRQLQEVLQARNLTSASLGTVIDANRLQDINYTTANLGLVLDAKLYLLFDRYISSAPAADRAAILDEQRRWLEKRKQAAEEAHAGYVGGAFAPFVVHPDFLELTTDRIKEIDRRLETAMAMQP